MGGWGRGLSTLPSWAPPPTSTAPIPAVSLPLAGGRYGVFVLEGEEASRLPLPSICTYPAPPLPAERLSPGQVGSGGASDLPGKLSLNLYEQVRISTLALGLPYNNQPPAWSQRPHHRPSGLRPSPSFPVPALDFLALSRADWVLSIPLSGRCLLSPACLSALP